MSTKSTAVLFVAAVVATALAAHGEQQSSPPTNSTGESDKPTELKWARGVADDFLAAWISGGNAQAEMLVTDEMKKRYAQYPQCTPLAQQLLDVQYAGLTTGNIAREEIAPDENEARFTGKLVGERNKRPIESEFALRVVKESGKWRVSFFRQQWHWVDDLGSRKK